MKWTILTALSGALLAFYMIRAILAVAEGEVGFWDMFLLFAMAVGMAVSSYMAGSWFYFH